MLLRLQQSVDNVNHRKLISLLIDLKLDSKDIKLIRNLYWMHESAVRVEEGTTGYNRIEKGVKQ